MAKLVCHLEKNGRSRINSIERHNSHSSLDLASKIVFPDKTINNYFLISSAKENLSKNIFTRIGKRENPQKNIRKDAVLLCDILISASAELFESLDSKELASFFLKACEFLKERYSIDNCAYAVVHMDEAVPHMHFGIIPMTYDNYLCAKKLFHRNELQQLQSLLPLFLSNLGFNIQTSNSVTTNYESKQDNNNISSSPEYNKVESYVKQLEILKRENNCLKLEKMYIDRKLRLLLDIIKDNPSLEEIFYTNVAKNTSAKNIPIGG